MAQFTNQAQLSYNNAVTNSNIAVGEILEVLSATKTAVRDVYGQNDQVTYIVSIVNTGTTAFSGISVTDNLGAYEMDNITLVPLTYRSETIRYYVNGVLQLAPAVTAGPPLVISGITVPAGGNVLLVYEADVNQFAPRGLEDSITNQAIVSGGGITPITVEETVNAETEPVLSITKSISPVPVAENGTLTYTFLIQNTGNAPALADDDAVITDLFEPILENITVTFDGAVWTEGIQYTYNEDTGLFTTIAGQVTVPAATYTQNEDGSWVINPGVSTLVITGTI